MVLDQHAHTFGVDPFVGVDSRTLHLAVAGWDSPRAKQPGNHVGRFGRQADEVEDALGVLPIRDRIGFERVNEVGELHWVTDEEDLQVVANQIPIAVLGVEFGGEAAGITQRFRAMAPVDDRRKADEDRRALALLLEQFGPGVLGDRLPADRPKRLEVSVRSGPSCMDDPLRDALPVEMGDLFDEVVVLQRGRTPFADRADTLVIHDRMTLAGRQPRLLTFDLVRFGRSGVAVCLLVVHGNLQEGWWW